MPTTEAGIETFGLSQLYISLGDVTADGGIVVRVWWKPLVTLIWLGALVMMARRRRVAAATGGCASARRARERGRAGGAARGGMRSTRVSSLGRWLFACAARPLAVQPDEVLADPALEARARALSAELRCMVCQNQSIDDSDADLARDLRMLVRERLAAGDSDAAGDGLRRRALRRVRPAEAARSTPHTLLLWVGAAAACCIVGGVRASPRHALADGGRTRHSLTPSSARGRRQLDGSRGWRRKIAEQLAEHCPLMFRTLQSGTMTTLSPCSPA